MLLFSLPADRRARRASEPAPLVPTMTPASYLRLRRKAAGLGKDQVAARLSPRVSDRGDARMLVDMLETEGCKARKPETLDALRAVFAFDPDVYRQLATEPSDRHPQVCRGCGCSKWDACDEAGQGCAWATAYSCTRCVEADVGQAETFQ
jgi:hypothetical protein